MRGVTIDTGRLRLRPHDLGDLPARVALTNDLAVMRHVGGAAQDVEENHARILRYAGHWALRGHGFFAVEETATGAFVGEVGVADFHRGLGADFDGRPEAGWMLAAEKWGLGYGREAVAAAIAWHEGHVGAGEMVCMIAPDNHASRALAAKLGFRPTRGATYHGREVLLHARNGPLHKSGAGA